MIERSERRFLLCDQTKFERSSLELVCPLSDLDHLITDAPPPRDLRAALQEAGVELHTTEDEGTEDQAAGTGL